MNKKHILDILNNPKTTKAAITKLINVKKISVSSNVKKQNLIIFAANIYGIPLSKLCSNTNKSQSAWYLRKGKRDYMEDQMCYYENKSIVFSGVFDGHGGGSCSLFLKSALFKYFQKYVTYTKGIKMSLYNSICNANGDFLKKRTNAGSTCNVVIINKKTNNFFVANVGDSRAIVCYKNGAVKQITRDHKPTNQYEKTQIEKRGGFVSRGRVDGILAMSRAIGDKNISQHICCIPDIFEGSLANIKYIIQGSDGLFDVMTNKQICNFISTHSKNKTLKQVAKMLVDYAIDVKGSTDNTSVLITLIK